MSREHESIYYSAPTTIQQGQSVLIERVATLGSKVTQKSSTWIVDHERVPKILKQLFTLSRVYDGIPFVIMRLPHSNSFKCTRTIELYGTYSSTGIQRKIRHAFALLRSNDVIMLMYADICQLLARNYQPIRARIRRTPIVYIFDWAYELRLDRIGLGYVFGIWIMGLFIPCF